MAEKTTKTEGAHPARDVSPLAQVARHYFDERDQEAGGPAAQTKMRIILDTGRGYVLEASERGVLMRLIEGDQYVMDATDDEEAARLAALCIPSPDRVIALANARLASFFGVDDSCIMRCATYIYLGEPTDAPLPDEQGHSVVDGHEVRRLDASFLDAVCAHYHALPRELVLDHLRHGRMYGGFTPQGELAGFVGEHTEGSIGLLEVLPEHRRRGWAQALEKLMINLHLSQGRMPYCQVECHNAPSHALQTKLGYTKLPGEQCWIEG